MSNQSSPVIPKRNSYFNVILGNEPFVIDNLSELPELQSDHPGKTLKELKLVEHNEFIFSDVEGELCEVELMIRAAACNLRSMDDSGDTMDDKLLRMILQVKCIEDKLHRIETNLGNQHHCY